MEYLIMFVIFGLIGVGIYSLDAIGGKFLKKDLAKYKGIIIGRKITRKIVIAGVVIAVKFWIVNMLFSGHTDLAKVFVTTAFEWASVIAGFYLAPWARTQLPRLTKKGLAYADKLEKGKTDPIEDIKDEAKKVIAEKITGSKKDETSLPTDEKTKVNVEEQKAEEKPKVNPLANMESSVEKFKKGM